MEGKWVTVVTAVTSIITGLLGLYGGIYQSEYTYKVEVSKHENETILDKQNHEQEIIKEKIKFYTSRCEKLNSINAELIALYAVGAFEGASSIDFDGIANAEKIKLKALSVKSYFDEESDKAFWSSFEVASKTTGSSIEATYKATLNALSVELKKCNSSGSFPKA